MNISGHGAVVTGGASGLGRAAAEALHAAGAKVAILDVNARAAEQVASGLGGFAAACDVTNADDTASALGATEEAIGPIRACINCAGVGPAKRIISRDGPMNLDDFARVVQINLIGTFNVLRLASAQMAKLEPLPDGERGVVINTASIAAYEGQVGQAAYASSKGGVASLTLPAARELARYGIRVLAIAPGIFETPMLQALPDTAQQSLAAAIPFPTRLGRPSEFAALVMHMVENTMLNGEVVRIDGAIRLTAD
jgi:NAD(P)-dependent dehydrogenase (short-subunit alcohol dehydrogenase family)